MSLLKKSTPSLFVYDEETRSFIKDKEAAKHSDETLNGPQARRKFMKRKLAEDEAWMQVPEYVQEREWPIFQTVTAFTLDCIKQYLALKAEAAKNSNITSTSTKEWTYKDLMRDLDESEVLRRLLTGKKPLAVAPPKSYLHHWYDLVDDGEGVCIEVDEKVTSYTTYSSGVQNNDKKIRIDSEDWKVVEVIEQGKEKSYIVQWKDTPYIFKLQRMTADDFERMLNPRLRKLVTDKNYSWKLTRWENENGNDGE